jgi:hypothetical protein
MPWKTMDVQEERVRFVVAASREQKSFTALWRVATGLSRADRNPWVAGGPCLSRAGRNPWVPHFSRPLRKVGIAPYVRGHP